MNALETIDKRRGLVKSATIMARSNAMFQKELRQEREKADQKRAHDIQIHSEIVDEIRQRTNPSYVDTMKE